MKKTFTLIALLAVGVAHAQVPTNGLFAYYPFNGNANDEAGSLNGTISNAFLTPDRHNNPNSALYFNGTTSFVNLGTSLAWRLNENDAFTVSAWVNTAGDFGASLAAVFARWGGTLQYDDYALFLTQNARYPSMAINSPSNNTVGPAAAVPSNAWAQLVFSFSKISGRHKIYLNGTVVYNQVHAGAVASPSATTTVMIGAQATLPTGQVRFFKGSIDDVRVYSRDLSDSEVSQLYNAEVVNGSGCDAVQVTQHPQGTGICAGTSSATLSVAVAEPTASIQWQFNSGGGWGDMTGETGLTVEAAAAGQYRAEVTADCGTITYSNAATVTSGGPAFVEPVPSQAWLCSDQPHVMLTANAVGEGITYQWRKNEVGQPNNNQVNIPGATASTYEATEAGVFYSVVITACGVSEASGLIQIGTFPDPSVTIFGNEPSTICSGQTWSMFTQVNQTGTQVWEPGGVASGSLTVSPTETTVYTVTHTTTLTGCTATASRTIIVIEPEVPIISESMGVLSVPNTYLSYQWLLDEQNIPGANSSSHIPAQNGHYGVIVTQTGGNLGNCTYESDMYHFTGIVTGINDLEGQSFTVFPNPFTNEMTVEVKAPTVLTLHNVLGAEVMSQAVNGRTMISTETLPAGVYFLRDAASANVVRVVKQ
jgi:hypothetical protein